MTSGIAKGTLQGPLRIFIATMPRWPGPQEAEKAVGVWPATVSPSAEVADKALGKGEL